MTHNFMAADLRASFLAICLFPLFLAIPGYAVARWFDLFDFRRRTPAFRLVASIPLSIAVAPILTYLLGRVSGAAVWGMYVAFAVYFLVSLLQDRRQGYRWRPSWSRESLVFVGISAVWMAVALLSLVDLQLGDKTYFSTLSIDYSLRTAFIQSISTTGIPPHNPLFSPGQAFPLRYHYFWLLLCSLMDQLGGSAINARQAMIGGTFWCGLGLMATVALYCRLFTMQTQTAFQRRARIGILLLAVTGLDLIPTLGFQQVFHIVFACMDWWNEQVVGFVSSTLWEPHYLSGLIACLAGFLVLWEAPRQQTVRRRAEHAVVGGVALATAVGASIYVTFTFGIFLVVWTAVTVWKKWRTETAILLAAGLVTALLAAPYLLGLRGTAAGASGEGPLFQFHVRTFKVAEMAMQGRGAAPWATALVNTIFLPLNYFLELGFFLVAGRIWWQRRKADGGVWERRDLALGLMVATSILVCTFIRSSVIGNNDLGWRGFLVAQFGLVLCAVDVLTDRAAMAKARQGLIVLLAIGAAGTVYDVAILRFYPVLADAGKLPMLAWLGTDRQLGKRTTALRETYEWIDRTTDSRTVLQFEPHQVIEDIPALYYSNRPALAGDENCLVTFGGTPSLCAPVMAKVNELFSLPGKPAAPALADACGSLPLDMLVVKDTDPAWRASGSWVWNEKPVYTNPYVRVFRCK